MTATTVQQLTRDWHKNAPASAAAIRHWLRTAGDPQLPRDYLAFLRRANGGATASRALWRAELESVEHIPDLNRTYGSPKGLLLFGHANAGWALAFDLRGSTTHVVLFDLIHMKIHQRLGDTLAESLSRLEQGAARRLRRTRRKLPCPSVRTDIGYVPTPPHIVRRMLRLSGVAPGELLYDLGCGDGRIVIAAAKLHGARAIGFDIDPERVREARDNVRKAGVEGLVEIREGNLFRVDLSAADVVTVYLLPSINDRLLPRFRRLKPGARVVSHAFGIENVAEDRLVEIQGRDGRLRHLYLWEAPLRRAAAD